MKSKNLGGFTLIELLVVISIIGVLSSVVLTSLTEVRARARDTKWLAELKQIQTVMAVYKNDTGYYPGDVSSANGSSQFQLALNDLVVEGYFDETKGIPLPTLNGGGKLYYFDCEHWNTSGIPGYSNCINIFPGYTAEGYVIVFNTESIELDLPTFYSLGYYTGSPD